MGLLSWLSGLVALFRDPWADVESWRRRREEAVPPENRHKPTYSAYPDDGSLPDERHYIEARDIRGRIRREYVDLEGYSVHQINLRSGAKRGGILVRDWYFGQVLEARIRLRLKLDEVREAKERP